MLLINRTGEMLNVSAHTGAPICASTILVPRLLKNVLFPAIFDPVTIATFPVPEKVKSEATLVSGGSKGWPIPLACSVKCAAGISGNAHDGWLKCKVARL